MMVGRGEGNAFIDTLEPGMKRNKIVYRIVVDETEVEVKLGRQADAWLLAVADDYFWQLKHTATSTKAVAYCIRQEKGNCPECFSEDLNKRIKSMCNTCDGSGKLSSFVGPLPMRYAPMGRERTQATMGDIEKEVETISAWTGNTPILRIGDILITAEHIKYKVQDIPRVSIMHSAKDGKEFLARQWVTLRRLNEDEYPMLKYIEAKGKE